MLIFYKQQSHFSQILTLRKNNIYIYFTGNNVFYIDGDEQLRVGPLPSSDAKQIKGIYFHT